MCGFLAEISSSLISSKQFKSLLNLSFQRGPDQQDFWTNEVNCQMGFNRLAILDVSDNGRQPISSPSGRYLLLFNGEIYNYRELRNKYRIADADLRSQSDSEILSHMVDLLSISELAKELNGMFAICIYDSYERTVSLIRDFAGIKPLFYGLNENAFVVASQFDQVFQHPAFINDLKLRPDVIKEYFGLGYMPAPNTIYKNIYQMEPGTWLIYSISSKKIVRQEKYFQWKCEELNKEESPNTIDTFNSIFSTVIKDQLNADVPLATFLSGGIDSPLVTAHAVKYKPQVEAFTVGLDDAGMDESGIARQYADHLKVRHTTEHFERKDLLEMLDAHFEVMPEPLGDYSSLPSYVITKKAKANATVMLSGDGGDELFWGYPRFLTQSFYAPFFQVPLWLRRPFVKVFRKLTKIHITAAMDHPGTFTDWTYNTHTYLFKEQLDTLVPGTDISKETKQLYSYEESLSNRKNILQWLKKNEFYGHLQRVLRKVDITSMGNSLEVRVPFLDKRVIEFSNQVKPALSIQHNTLKYILKKALENFIPSSLIFQEKKGFSIPLEDYLRNELKEEITSMCLHTSIYGAENINTSFFKSYVDEFMLHKHNNAWGVWHLYVWQKWAKKYDLI